MKIIPNKITMFRRKQTPEGTPAFPVRVGASEGASITAKLWVANESRWAYKSNYEGAKDRADAAAVEAVVIGNEPRRGFRIVGAEQRAEGGRAWKVVTPDGDLVDMREDVFLPILLDRGLPKGGVIDAAFQWCQNGSQIRLEEVGSPQHKAYTPETGSSEKKPARKKGAFKKKDLVVGGVYDTAWFGNVVYLGDVAWLGRNYLAWVIAGNPKSLYISSAPTVLRQIPGKRYEGEFVQEAQKKANFLSRFTGQGIAFLHEEKWHSYNTHLVIPEGTELIWK